MCYGLIYFYLYFFAYNIFLNLFCKQKGGMPEKYPLEM